MDNQGSAEIRIVRRKKGHGGGHGGAWKVAFADFMTAMMAFFLVMWVSGMSTSIKAAVQAYFKDPIGFKKAVAAGNAPFAISEAAIGGTRENTGKGGPQALNLQISPDSNEFGQIKSKIEKLISNTPEFKDLKQFIDVHLTREGLQIELLEARRSLFFDSGSSAVKPKTRLLLLKLAKELAHVDNKIIVEGHTDSLPLKRSDGYSNWELSADRANGARRILEMGGIKHGQIVQVRGLADNDLRDPKHPESCTNRRVSIILLYNKAKQVPKQAIKDGTISISDVKKTDKAQTEGPAEPQSASSADEPDASDIYSKPPLKTGTGDHKITVITREGKVYKMQSGDLTEGLIPKFKTKQ